MSERKKENGFIVSLDSVKKVYSSGHNTLPVLLDVSLKITSGEILVITGESGCGKSTLLNLIGGLDDVTSGIITVDSWNVTSLGEEMLTKYRQNIIGYVFQFHYLLKDFTALENVMLPGYIRGVSRKEASDRAEYLLNLVHMEERLSHFPMELSGGERQRVTFARALMNDPKVILADEPTGNLDEWNSRNVEEILFSLTKEQEKTLILVSHDRFLAGKGDRHCILTKGMLVEE